MSPTAISSMDVTSSGRHRSDEVENVRRVWANTLKLNRDANNQKCPNNEISFEPHSCDDDYDR